MALKKQVGENVTVTRILCESSNQKSGYLGMMNGLEMCVFLKKNSQEMSALL